MSNLIISWNINGLRDPVFYFLKEFLELNKPAVLCLNETKRKKQILEEKLEELNYNYIINDHLPSQYHGVVMLIRKDLVFEEISFHLDIESRKDNQSNDATKGRVIHIKIFGINLVMVYVPNSGRGLKYHDYRMNWDKAFYEKLQTIDNLILIGDLNVALEDRDVSHPNKMKYLPGFTKEERENYRKFLQDSKLIDIWRKRHSDLSYTWRGGIYAMRIDAVLISESIKDRITKTFILENSEIPSDHCLFGFRIK